MTGRVNIRMYNVGFGDAFMLTFPGRDRPRRVLIDCGSHSSGPGPRPMRDMVAKIIADATDADGVSRLDVVVATHRHQDHVSGFSQAAWSAVDVGEVWMPWTEHPTDGEARRIREAQSNRARSLMLALNHLGAADSVLSMVSNALTNAKAMLTLHQGFRGKPLRRFLPRRRGARSFATPVLPGVEVHVLGPSFNAEVIREMDPARGERYLQFLMARREPPGQRLRPFRQEWSLSLAAHRRAYPHLLFSDRDRRGFSKLGDGSAFELATTLEQAVNGTSLMLMFVIGRANLLFPGDAQWGTWKAALATPEVRELLSKTVFYKIGHHGSHNATPRTFVDKVLSKTFSAMVSTRHIDKWPDIPRLPLLQALRSRSDRVVRSDRRDHPDPTGFTRGAEFVDTSVKI